MIDKGVRYCDRCGKPLTRNNNKCGYELCDTCNEWLENKVHNNKEVKNNDNVSNFKITNVPD